jgi:sterol 3beta-glucosyltransferase
VSSCDPVDETRFKVRTPERNYTFKADTSDGRDEWVKSIQKVMFKTQHEGESVKLIIPLEAVLDVEQNPTLEFAETIEVRCMDSDDQMSIDSYFFASFQNGEKALKAIRDRLAARPSSDLPMDSTSTLPTDDSAPQKQRTTQHTVSHAATGGLKKLGSILKPIIPGIGHKSHHDDDTPAKVKASSSTMPSAHGRRPSNDSMETLTPEAQVDEGYPPRQAGAAPAGMGEDSKSWGPDWIRKPVTKIISSSSSSSTKPSEHRRRASDHLAEQLNIQQHVTRHQKGTRETVTEVVEPVVNDGAISDSEDDNETSRHSSRARFSHSTTDQGYSMMEHTEEGDKEYAETAKKFRSVFALSEAEELIDRE